MILCDIYLHKALQHILTQSLTSSESKVVKNFALLILALKKSPCIVQHYLNGTVHLPTPVGLMTGCQPLLWYALSNTVLLYCTSVAVH